MTWRLVAVAALLGTGLLAYVSARLMVGALLRTLDEIRQEQIGGSAR